MMPPAPAAAMELLAPAGTIAAFEAALAAGADAVYVGAPGLNARALARDFTFAEIAAMTVHAHERNKRLYVAMNSLVKEEEIPLALETLSVLAGIGPDALIIQDLGLLYLVQRFFPHLPAHASTLMTVNHATAARYFKELGFSRVVLARELSFAEIQAIHRQGAVELEMFIHGAMCFSYSGLCRFSSLHGGKSSLRGQCVQPCRRRYDWLPSGKRAGAGQGGKGGGYLFSMNDLSGIDHLAAARDAGVVSLKIEGRLRSVAYVRHTVQAYRLALDALDLVPARQAEMLAEAHRLLAASMGRKRAPGFLLAGQEDRLIVPRLSGSMGEVVGKVVRLETARRQPTDRTAQAQVVVQAPLRLGDRLRFYEERTGERTSFTLRAMAIKGRQVERAEAGQTVSIQLTGLDPARLRQPLHGVLFRVDVSGRDDGKGSALARTAMRMIAPLPDPATLERLLADLGLDPAITPRPAASGRPAGERRGPGRGAARSGRSTAPEWWLKVGSPEAMTLRYPFQVARVLVELNRQTLAWGLQTNQRRSGRMPLVWTLPAVLREEHLPWYGEAIGQLRRQGTECFQIGHIGQFGLFTGPGQPAGNGPLTLYGDCTCNVLNSLALRMVAARGLAGIQFSLETDRATLASALTDFARTAPAPETRPMQVGLPVYGRPPLFTARLDAPHFQGQRSFASPHGERLYLDRRDEAVYVHAHTVFSLLAYVDELAAMGVDYFVVDVSHGQPKKNAADLIALLGGRGSPPPTFSGNYAGILS